MSIDRRGQAGRLLPHFVDQAEAQPTCCALEQTRQRGATLVALPLLADAGVSGPAAVVSLGWPGGRSACCVCSRFAYAARGGGRAPRVAWLGAVASVRRGSGGWFWEWALSAARRPWAADNDRAGGAERGICWFRQDSRVVSVRRDRSRGAAEPIYKNRRVRGYRRALDTFGFTARVLADAAATGWSPLERSIGCETRELGRGGRSGGRNAVQRTRAPLRRRRSGRRGPVRGVIRPSRAPLARGSRR
jgi:hypothetical protein